ncbi:TIGR02453 family protein [Vannielia litorea]|uniref:TIGR02453 family protein n=1 Tax=Vannielia litorea TaxID=1217970 RepID=UPI001BCF3B93|nr:TIGR02453 family protein [Vannielia litorea]
MFSTLLPNARAFFTDLAANNSRDWFLAHKDSYDAKVATPGKALAEALSARLTALTGHEMRPKIFRQNRDIRFSKDKSPYKAHLHMLWSESGDRDTPAFFLGIDPGALTAGTGQFGFAKPQLERWRAAVAGPEGEKLAALIAPFRLRDPELKRVPAPYPADHPRAQLLRHKGFSAWLDLDPDDPRPVDEIATDAFERLAPVWRWLTAL